MKIAIDVRHLKIGMYVCELDRPWEGTPFMFQGFEIRKLEQIEALRQHCRTVYILKPEARASVAIRRKPLPVDTMTVDWSKRIRTPLRIEQELYRINNHPAARSAYEDTTSMPEEVDLVRDVFIDTRLLIQEVLHDAKLGRSLNLPGARQAVRGLTESILRNPDALTCLAQIKRKDDYIAMHSLRVCVLALSLGRQIGLPRAQLEALGLGALLHDIGMTRVPDEIVKRPEPLTADEQKLMQQHVAWGVDMLAGNPNIPVAALEVVGNHHERYDGSGYLRGLRGDRIGDFGMIGAIVDHYDAITSDRVHMTAVSAYSALTQMYDWRDRLFSGWLVEKFIQCLGIYPVGSVVELNSGEVGVVTAINRSARLKPYVMLIYHADRRPYEDMPIASLATRRTPDDRPCEIERVIEPAAAGIDPTHYLQAAVGY